jgi:hypothetical protein
VVVVVVAVKQSGVLITPLLQPMQVGGMRMRSGPPFWAAGAA